MEIVQQSHSNPFLKDLVIKEDSRITKIAEAPDKILIDTKDKSVEGIKIVYAKEVQLDRAPYVKLFKPTKDNNQTIDFSNLSKSGLLLLYYILYNGARFNNDMILLSYELIEESRFFTKSRSSFDNAVRDLKKFNIIADHPSVNGAYWLNVNMFYFGERRHLVIHKEVKVLTDESKNFKVTN